MHFPCLEVQLTNLDLSGFYQLRNNMVIAYFMCNRWRAFINIVSFYFRCRSYLLFTPLLYPICYTATATICYCYIQYCYYERCYWSFLLFIATATPHTATPFLLLLPPLLQRCRIRKINIWFVSSKEFPSSFPLYLFICPQKIMLVDIDLSNSTTKLFLLDNLKYSYSI